MDNTAYEQISNIQVFAEVQPELVQAFNSIEAQKHTALMRLFFVLTRTIQQEEEEILTRSRSASQPYEVVKHVNKSMIAIQRAIELTLRSIAIVQRSPQYTSLSHSLCANIRTSLRSVLRTLSAYIPPQQSTLAVKIHIESPSGNNQINRIITQTYIPHVDSIEHSH